MITKEKDILPPSYPHTENTEGTERNSIVDDQLQDWIINQFHNRCYRTAVYQCLESTMPKLYDRWQLGYSPIVHYKRDNEIFLEYPSLQKLQENNRGSHSLAVASIGLSLASSWNMSEEDALVITLAALLHDREHPTFSHVGENSLHNIYNSSKSVNDELHHVLAEYNLHISHEDRLQQVLSLPQDYPQISFLYETIPSHVRKIQKTLREKGTLGELLKICGTCAYLNHDSQYFGWEAPHFETYLVNSIYPQSNGLATDNSFYDREIVRRFLSYRYFLYTHQYQHPINQLFEELHTRSLLRYLTSSYSSLEMREKVKGLIVDGDYKNLRTLRSWSLSHQRIENCVFFYFPERSFRYTTDTSSSDSSIIECPTVLPKSKSLCFQTTREEIVPFTIDPMVSPQQCNMIGSEMLRIQFIRSFSEIVHLYSKIGKNTQLSLPHLDSSRWEYDSKSLEIYHIPRYTVALNKMLLGNLS